MSKETSMKLIAEGVETYGELKKLIKLGVHNAQGYLLQKPCETISSHLPEVCDLILQINKDILNNFSFEYAYNCVGKISKNIKSYSPETSCKDIKTIFENITFDSLCITSKAGYPVGLIMENNLNSRLADRYGYNLYSGRPIKLLMDIQPLTIDYYTPVSTALTLAMQRKKREYLG